MAADSMDNLLPLVSKTIPLRKILREILDFYKNSTDPTADDIRLEHAHTLKLGWLVTELPSVEDAIIVLMQGLEEVSLQSAWQRVD